MKRLKFIALGLSLLLMVSLSITIKNAACQIPEEQKLSFEILTPEYDPVRVRIGDLMVEWFKEIGVKLVNKPVDFSTLIDSVYNTFDFHLYIIETAAQFEPWYLSAYYVSWEDRPGGNNPWGLHNDTYDTLAKEVATAVDPEERREILFEMQQILAEQVPIIPLYCRDWMQAYRSDKIKDVVGMAGGVLNFWTFITMTTRATPGHGTVTVAMMDYVKNFNPLKEETWYDWFFNLVIYDRLFQVDVDLSLKPWICKEWSVSADGLTWTFKIHNNVTWHDGTPLTVHDLNFTIWFVKENEVPAWYSAVMYVKKTEILDDYTIKITLNQTDAWFLRKFGTFIILPKHIWEGLAWDTPEPPEIVGCGPFRLVDRKEGEWIKMERHTEYFKSGYPRIDTLIYKVVSSPEAQYLALKTGEVDIMCWTLPYGVIKEAVEHPDITPAPYPDTYYGIIGFNLRDQRLGDVNVRRALAHAIDKETIVNLLMLGWAAPVYTYVHHNYTEWCNFDIPRYEFNLTRANEILDKAGYIDVDGDGIRELPGVSPPPKPIPVWIWATVAAAVIAIVAIIAAVYYVKKAKPAT